MLKYFDLFLWSAGGGDKTLIWGDLLSSNGLGLVCARQDQWSALSHHCSLRTLLESDWCVPRVSRYEHYDDDLIQAHIGSNLLLCLTATDWCEVGSGCIMNIVKIKISHICNTETGWLMCCKIVNIMHCVNTDDCSKSNCATIIFLSLDIILRRHSQLKQLFLWTKFLIIIIHWCFWNFSSKNVSLECLEIFMMHLLITYFGACFDSGLTMCAHQHWTLSLVMRPLCCLSRFVNIN